ncbi:hypothetical protein [Chthonobacter albigriseus]|uniref:hypothetical protein n=1 Tax=Chthonobacter albigriseus TaxID=1683161 RepID=UPI0015EF3965|nr:hypothetical protein [Chthonobacter albigriseus]
MDLATASSIVRVPDVGHRVRQLRWFQSTFRRHAALVMGEHGLSGEVDGTRLTSAFLAWLERFHATRFYARMNRPDFICYTAGCMLSELIRAEPLRVRVVQPGLGGPAEVWPAGFVYVSYCLSVAAAVQEQDIGAPLSPAAILDRADIWTSFRENAEEDPATAISFFDLFVGRRPNWTTPEMPILRPAARAGSRLEARA